MDDNMNGKKDKINVKDIIERDLIVKEGFNMRRDGNVGLIVAVLGFVLTVATAHFSVTTTARGRDIAFLGGSVGVMALAGGLIYWNVSRGKFRDWFERHREHLRRYGWTEL